MNRLFRYIPLPVKLILIGFFPLLFLVFLSFQVYKEERAKIKILDGYLHSIRQCGYITRLVDELQKERRYSYGFLVKRQWRAELNLQRTATDAAWSTLATHTGTALRGMEKYTLLYRIDSLRLHIDEASLPPNEVMNYYTNVMLRLASLNNLSAGNIGYLHPVERELAGQRLLSQMSAYLGLMRLNVYNALYKQETSPQFITDLKEAYDLFRSYEAEFRLRSTPESVAELERRLRHTALLPVIGYLETAIREGRLAPGSEPERWWYVSLNAVLRLNELQQGLVKNAEEKIKDIYDQERTRQTYTVIVLAALIALVVAIIAFTIRSITGQLSQLKEAAGRIASGATGIDLHIASNDAIGSLARSFLLIDQNNRGLTEAADNIGKGDFSVTVKPRGEEDLLGNAIVRMKHRLRQYKADNEKKLWILGGVEQVNKCLQGEKGLLPLADDCLHALAQYLDAQVALFYINHDNVLHFSAGYAVSDFNEVPDQVPLGETVLGQALKHKQVVRLAGMPDGFLKIRTGSGSTPPKQLLVVPLVHNDEVEGVLEIGALHEFDEEALALIEQVRPRIAVVVRTARNRARLQELLRQTGEQAEELRRQQAELESINAELEEQTNRLQASEEELKVQQEELMQANSELEERSGQLEERNRVIRERNREVRKKAEELEQSARYKSEFLANMSHELRTPLNSILLLSRLLAENGERNLTGEQVEYALVIQSSGKGLLELIDEILDLSKIEAGKMELEYRPVALEDITADLKALFGPVAREKKIEFSIHEAAGVPARIVTDKTRLEQVLRNLIANALKFTAHGYVHLQIGPVPNRPSYLSFSVKDTGIGIPKEKQQLIFEAFQQADGSTRREYGGTGLGLSISRELTRLLEGEITVRSVPGEGSEFTVTVPVGAGRAEAPAPTAQPAAAPAGAEEATPAAAVPRLVVPSIPPPLPDDREAIDPGDKVILIVEDDVPFARALLDFTRSQGFKGLVAVRGDEGLALAGRYQPVGILLDLRLPVKDGWEVMEELKKDPATRHIPVHIMSSEEAKKESLYKGAVDFINKPMALDRMKEIFDRIEQARERGSKKVLIVEEHARHARALAYFLEPYGVHAAICGNRHECLEALQQDGVDCVILDLDLTDRSSFPVLEAIRRESGLEHLPVIWFTGKQPGKADEAAIRQYADTIVIKTAQSYQRILDEVSLFLHLVQDGEGATAGAGPGPALFGEVLAHKKVLIVDDDVRNIFSLTKALEAQQMTVLSAMDGAEALRQLEAAPDVDAVLMDLMMPVMDGYEAIRRIRLAPAFAHLPVIAVTARAMAEDREKCMEAGASDFITKPVDTDQLLSLLRVWLYDKGFDHH
ncbi:response regulator [Paraflavisolibacter sp. H34]|uniref:response regulator n=1 Tax=Huijunlia imazamoxiresistens TaxID=3127457 RepID=UPI00301660E9